MECKKKELKYEAIASLYGGQQIMSPVGSFEDCAAWTEDVIRENGADITVRIRQVAEDGKQP